ncbi:hypothetical protein QTO34_007574 [Cnephaeus nilssonii]|uniref:Gasdermin pore forming domain-containing protein n=1 Tax=Cnephaeus nilssonii TaxID=3371016 RepID=A0AA40HIR0_CNENI|nr:hypothetical protein QTO34_007574 [Eptesicus nilssonii]
MGASNMPSMFERTTKKLVKEIGDQELRPVKCLLSATKIRRFSLIRGKKARSQFWQLPDVPLEVSLMHILEPGSSVPVPDAPVKVPADFSDFVVRKQQAAGNVNAGAEAGFSEETTVCRGSFLEYQIVSTPHETWTELQKRKLPDPEPAFLKQCREAGVNLYVVTDTVELLNSPVLQDLSSANVSGKFSTPGNIWVQQPVQTAPKSPNPKQGGEEWNSTVAPAEWPQTVADLHPIGDPETSERRGQCEIQTSTPHIHKVKDREGSQSEEKKLTVPKGSVLAYKRKQLVFYSREWEILHIAYRDDQETFPTGMRHIAYNHRREIFPTAGICQPQSFSGQETVGWDVISPQDPFLQLKAHVIAFTGL